MTRHYSRAEIVSSTVTVWTPWGHLDVPRAAAEADAAREDHDTTARRKRMRSPARTLAPKLTSGRRGN